MALLRVEDFTDALPDTPPEEIARLIEGAEAIAALYAPCITSPTFKHKQAAAAIIRKAIIYEVQSQEEGSNIARESVGPHSVDYRTPTRSGNYFSKQQIETLQRMCAAAAPGMYSIGLTVHEG
jgi:hypothetical protein